MGRGESSVVLLGGEPGIGKTALLTEVLRQSRERGYRVLDGRAVEVERDRPFGVLVDAIEPRLQAPHLELGEAVTATDRALLASVFPSLPRPSEELAGKPEPDERHRLLGAIHALLKLLAGEEPMVLALDDLHWADPASIDLVCRLLHRGAAMPLLLVLASRPTKSEPLRTAFEQAERHGELRRIELQPLRASDAEGMLGAEIDRPTRELLYRESGGNPFFLEQLAGAARLEDRPGGRDGGATEPGVPAAVGAAIRSELARLSAPAQILLNGAALLGEPFDPEFAAEAAGGGGDWSTALDELVASGLVHDTDSPRGFHFRHPIMRRAVYEAAGSGWRIEAHARAAAALARRGAAAAARATHIEKSARIGDETAAGELLRAGEECAVRAPASAARWFGAALRLLAEREDNLELRLNLLIQRATALGISGQIEESRQVLQIFLDRSQAPELRVQAVIFTAILDELLGTQEEGRALLLSELQRLADQNGRQAADLKRELAFTCFLDADWRATREWAAEALGAECEGMVRVGSLAALGLAAFGQGELEQLSRSAGEAGELFDSLPDSAIAAHHPGIGIWLGWAEVCSEHPDDAIRHLERSIRILHATGQRHLTVGPLAVQGLALRHKGDGRGLRAVAEAATEAALLSSSDLFLSWAMALSCEASIWEGDLHAAIRDGERALAAASASSSPQSEIARIQLASALLEIGEPERCRDLLVDSGSGEPQLPPFPLFETGCYELLVRVEVALGDIDRAEQLALRAAERAASLHLDLCQAQAGRARALVLLERGEAEPAAEEALGALAAAERAAAPVEAARSRILAGAALAADGKREPAIALLEDARAQFLRCGALRDADHAARELRKLGRSTPHAGGGPSPGRSALDLTKREVEVMELVASGLTNRRIAAKLFLSVRTVDRHVSRIFDKLEVRSRAAAASVFERARQATP